MLKKVIPVRNLLKEIHPIVINLMSLMNLVTILIQTVEVEIQDSQKMLRILEEIVLLVDKKLLGELHLADQVEKEMINKALVKLQKLRQESSLLKTVVTDCS